MWLIIRRFQMYSLNLYFFTDPMLSLLESGSNHEFVTDEIFFVSMDALKASGSCRGFDEGRYARMSWILSDSKKLSYFFRYFFKAE